jgi:integrase
VWTGDLLETSPLIGLKPPAKARDRSRALSLPEIVRVYRAADGIGYPFGTIANLLILTEQRRGEVAGMERGEFDKPSKLWTIPGTRTKNGREHPLPIGPMARRIVRTTPRRHDRFLFPARASYRLAHPQSHKRDVSLRRRRLKPLRVPRRNARRAAEAGEALTR